MNAVAYCLLEGLRVAGPNHPALTSSEETLTYGALVARVAQFSAALRESGVFARDRVAMVMRDTPDIVALHQAVMATGAIAAALSTRAGPDELALILSIVRPRILVADEASSGVTASAIKVASPETRLLHRERELKRWKERPETEPIIAPVRLTDPAFWVMTSGTTGTPKAVVHRHDNVSVSADYYAQVLGTSFTDRLFATSRFHFAYAIGNMFAGLRIGASNILLEQWATVADVAEAVEQFKPTVLLSVPALYHKLLDAGLPSTSGFRRLTHYVSAGERLPPKIWADWEAASGLPILDGLGCSELVYMIIGNTPSVRRPGSSGIAMPQVGLRIMDENDMVITDADKTGRLEVRMPSVCSGYCTDGRSDSLYRPTERFKADGWFATGDEYSRDADGFFHHRGRSGDILRVSGIWIAPAEIEDVLAGTRGITETAAVLGENSIGLAEIALFVVPSAGVEGAAAVAAARERLANNLPHYKLPRRFEVVQELPRTATGKIQRHKLRERLRSESR